MVYETTIKIKVLNNTNKDDVSKEIAVIKESMTEDYSKTFEKKNKTVIFKTNIEIEEVESVNENEDFYVELFEYEEGVTPKEYEKVMGRTMNRHNSQINHLKIRIRTKFKDDDNYTNVGVSGLGRTSSHELGHALGLKHPNNNQDLQDKYYNNLMHQSKDLEYIDFDKSKSHKLLFKQLKKVVRRIQREQKKAKK